MKKITLVLVLLACATFAFAQAAEVTVDGDATLTWGVDLETNATGFTNAYSASIDVDLVPEATEELTGDAVYGSIKLKEFEVVIDEDDGVTVSEPSISAELLLTDSLSVAIYGAPDFSIDNALGFVHIGDDPDDDPELTFVEAAIAGTTGGVSATYSFGDLGSATVKVASHGNWDAADDVDAEYGWDDADDDPMTADTWELLTAASTGTANVDNLYSAGLDVALTPIDMLGLDFGVMYGDFTAGNIGLTASLTLDPMDMLGVWANFDAAKAGSADLVFDTSFGVDVTLEGTATLGVAGYYGNDDLEVGIDADLTAVENLTLGVEFDLYTVLTTSAWATEIDLAYDIDGIKPYATINLDSANVTGINAGVELTGQVPNTTFKIDYKTADVSNDNGDVEASVKIAF